VNDRVPPNWHKLSLGALWERLNDRQAHPTPQVVIEAIMYCVRTRGIAALQEPENLRRLRQCDEAAIEQITKRLNKYKRAA